MEFLIDGSLSNILVWVIIALVVLSVIFVITSEYKRRSGSFDLTSIGWIIMSVVFPVIVPAIYLMVGRR